MVLKTADQAIHRPSVPGTPSQITPEYVLNPLSIYRMARSSVREKHAPDLSIAGTSPLPSMMSPEVTTLRSNTSGGTSQNARDRQPSQSPVVSVTNLSPQMENQMATPERSPSFNELQSFFASDFVSSWQPAETAFGNPEWVPGLPPWAPGIGSRMPDPT